MKRNQLVLLSVLALGLSGAAFAENTISGGVPGLQPSSFPMDAEASFDLPALETYADRVARTGDNPAAWGVSKREVEPHNVFPFGGGYIDD